MSSEQTATYLQALLTSVTISVIIPLLILGLMVFAAWVLMARAQRDKNFNIAEVFKDERDKVSSERVMLLATWASSTWALAVVMFAMPQHTVEVLGIYMGVWGVNNAVKFVAAKKYTPE
jgi:hypothetical protein